MLIIGCNNRLCPWNQWYNSWKYNWIRKFLKWISTFFSSFLKDSIFLYRLYPKKRGNRYRVWNGVPQQNTVSTLFEPRGSIFQNRFCEQVLTSSPPQGFLIMMANSKQNDNVFCCSKVVEFLMPFNIELRHKEIPWHPLLYQKASKSM